ncbi:hypothetical protein Zmor_004480 [Zophobas morio]|uniref:Uncharacterized protein n=1 Tax=Zophobas morio TaxID=2755281 RepID=A0AA38HJZ3_9CUCU|nr:hypothetical protein Zmor_004480 [Zophobas morio]
MSYIPQVYKYDGKTVDVSGALNAYKTILAPAMNSFDKDNYSGFYASYVMGMYDNSFYNNFLSGKDGSNYFEDTMNKNGDLGFNKPGGGNTLGYAAGLNQNIHLAQDANRKALA